MQLDVDFDVYKALTAKRKDETESYNDVLRGVLNLPRGKGQSESSKGAYVYKNVSLPAGTELRATYKGRTYFCHIKDGQWLDGNGRAHNSPSGAAMHITNLPANGWEFWECKLPGEARWRTLDKLRP
jgi:hypothetical protein